MPKGVKKIKSNKANKGDLHVGVKLVVPRHPDLDIEKAKYKQCKDRSVGFHCHPMGKS